MDCIQKYTILMTMAGEEAEMQRPGEGSWDVVVVGSGNAAMSAGLAALERGASVLMIEKADRDLAGGNTAYTAGAMRFVYEGNDDLMPLLADPEDPRLPGPISAPTRRGSSRRTCSASMTAARSRASSAS